MTDNTNVPCYNCICLPVCRHKKFHDLYFQCSILKIYFSWLENDAYVYTWVEDVLKPTLWSVDEDDNSRILTNREHEDEPYIAMGRK